MSSTSLASKIKEHIRKSDYGTIFVSIDFVDLADKPRIGVIFHRLESEQIIKRIIRGVYYKPKYSNSFQENIVPLPDDVAHAIARNNGWTIVPCGDTALSLLGLSTQIPDTWMYVSDGKYEEYTYNNITIKFKHATNKEFSKLSYKTALVVQSIKHLGKERIDDTVIKKLKSVLTEKEKETMLFESKAVTSWVYEHIKIICKY